LAAREEEEARQEAANSPRALSPSRGYHQGSEGPGWIAPVQAVDGLRAKSFDVIAGLVHLRAAVSQRAALVPARLHRHHQGKRGDPQACD